MIDRVMWALLPSLVLLMMYLRSVQTLKGVFPARIRTNWVSNVDCRTWRPSVVVRDGMSVPIDVYVDSEIRAYLNIRNQDRKVRLHLSKELEPQDVSIPMVRDMIEKKIAPLEKQSYGLAYRITSTNANGHNNYNPMARPRPLLSDDDVASALTQVAEDIAAMEASGIGGKGSIQIYVDKLKSLDAKEAQSKPYLLNMEDPNEARKMTFISFYQFYDIDDTTDMVEKLFALWKPFKALGRVYVASEGINGQMAVPSNVLENFYEACRSEPVFADPSSFFYFNLDHELPMAEYEATQPFKALHIRERAQILADGLEEPLDWRSSGALLEARDWHEQLDNPEAVILDCRNSYESDVGTFDGAIPLNTTFFRESWSALEEALKDVPKDRPIMTFCTGGIRCVKVNAYLHQKMGYSNVSRLKGGIIAYAKTIGEGEMATPTTVSSHSRLQVQGGLERHHDTPGQEVDAGGEVEMISGKLNRNSKFRGVNHVFDERMGAKITDDLLATCESCGVPCGSYTNCRGASCHVRFIQCPKCQAAYAGCCSLSCRNEASASTASGAAAITSLPGTDEGGRGSEGRGMQNANSNSAMRPRKSQAFRSAANAGGVTQVQVSQLSTTTTTSPRDSDEGAEKVEEVMLPSSSSSSPALPSQPFQLADEHVEDLARYCESVSSPEPPLALLLREETARKYAHSPGAARMISGHLQGSVLTLLVQLTNARSVLELGSFTGYSALSFAEGLKHSKNGLVQSCDIDADAAAVAQRYFAAFNEEAGREVIQFSLQSAQQTLEAARNAGDTKYDIVFIDADKMAYTTYLDELLGEGEGEGEGEGNSRIDGDGDGAEGGMGKAPLLRDGALVIVDNTLWKSLVLAQAAEDGSLQPSAPLREPAEFGKETRMVKLAKAMHRFNRYVAAHPRLSQVVLPMRDGLSIVRYSRGADDAGSGN